MGPGKQQRHQDDHAGSRRTGVRGKRRYGRRLPRADCRDHDRGGGFIGGLVTASALVLVLLAFDIKTLRQILPIDYKQMTAVGMLISVLTASGALLFNKPFFTHAHGYFNLPLFGKTSLHTAMLFDLGVYLVVVGVTMTIIQTIGESD